MTDNKKIILIDADDVLENLSYVWVDYLNERYGTHTKQSDLKDWDVSKAFPSLTHDQVYGVELEEELILRLAPVPDAPYYVKKLIDDGHTVYICTNTPYQILQTKLDKVIFKYFPYFTRSDVIVTAHKQLIKGDILIDDGPHNLVGGDYEKILVDAPYNETFDEKAIGAIRCYNWKEIYETVCRLIEKT